MNLNSLDYLFGGLSALGTLLSGVSAWHSRKARLQVDPSIKVIADPELPNTLREDITELREDVLAVGRVVGDHMRDGHGNGAHGR